MDFWKFEDQLAGVKLRRAYVDITGDIVSGLLLSQITYWFRPGVNGKSKLRVFKEGKFWLAKSRADWHIECGITLQQYKRAVKVLEELGFITTMRAVFGGTITTHIHLNVHALKKALVPLASFTPTIGVNHTDTPPPLASFTPINTETTITETTAETTCAVGAGNSAGALGEEPMDAKQMLSALQKKGAANPVSQWQSTLAKVTGTFSKDLTMKDRGQLKQLHTALSKAGVEPMAAIKFAIEQWPTFTFEVRSARGLSLAPTAPSIGFALKHHDVLVQLIASSTVPDLPIGQTTTKTLKSSKSQTESLENSETCDTVGLDEIESVLSQFTKAP